MEDCTAFAFKAAAAAARCAQGARRWHDGGESLLVRFRAFPSHGYSPSAHPPCCHWEARLDTHAHTQAAICAAAVERDET